jgi:hypothetical protein
VKKAKVSSSSSSNRKLRPALTPEARENQMIALAVDCAERQLLDGTASSQVIVHYLKLATAKERLEREKLERENELLRAKTDSVQSEQSQKELYAEALAAFRGYSGQGEPDEY